MVVADLSRGALLVILVAAVGTGVRAEDRKAGEAVNIMWRFDGNGRFPNIHPPSEWRRDRNILWKSPVEVGGYSSPVFVGDRIILRDREDRRRSGRHHAGRRHREAGQWRDLCAGLFEATYTTPLIEGNVLYVVDAEARALELSAKAEKGMQLRECWRTKLRGEFMASPIYRDGLFYTSDCQKCRLYIIDARTGEVLTVTQVVDKETQARKSVPGVKIDGLATARYTYASPVAAERGGFFFDDAGHTAVLELGREYRLTRVNKLEDACIGTPFFVDDKIIIRGSKTVYCIGVKP